MWPRMGIVYKVNLLRPFSPFSLFSVPSHLPDYSYPPSYLPTLPIKVSLLDTPQTLVWITKGSTHIVSVIPSEYAACPFPSNSSILLTSLAYNHDWWSYRQLRALQTNRTEGQFGHRPIYKPIVSLSFTTPSPIQISSEHYFEWREVDSPLPLVAIHIIIQDRKSVV